MTCDFCNYNSIEPQRIVYEDEDYMSFIDGTDGNYVLMIPKEHSEQLTDVVAVERFISLMQYISQAIKEATGAAEIKAETLLGDKRHVSIRLTPVRGTTPADFQERIMENLRKSNWYSTLNS